MMPIEAANTLVGPPRLRTLPKRNRKRKADYFFFLLEVLIRPLVSHPDLK